MANKVRECVKMRLDWEQLMTVKKMIEAGVKELDSSDKHHTLLRVVLLRLTDCIEGMLLRQQQSYLYSFEPFECVAITQLFSDLVFFKDKYYNQMAKFLVGKCSKYD